MWGEAFGLLRCCGSAFPSSLFLSLSLFLHLCVWLPGCLCMHILYIYLSRDLLSAAQLCTGRRARLQQQHQQQHQQRQQHHQLHNSLSFPYLSISLSLLPLPPPAPPPPPIFPQLFRNSIFPSTIFVASPPTPIPLVGEGTHTHTNAEKQEEEKYCDLLPLLQTVKANGDGIWLLPQGKALPLLLTHHLLQEREAKTGSKVEKNRYSTSGIWSTGSQEVKDGCGCPHWLQGSCLPLDFQQHQLQSQDFSACS